MIIGVRQSRRLAAFAEAPSHTPSDAHAAQQQGTPPQQQGSPPQQQGTAPHQQGMAPHQQGMAPRQQGTAPQQAEQTGVTQSAALLQASTLEASANVLKGLVRVLTVHCAAQGLGLDCTPCCSGLTIIVMTLPELAPRCSRPVQNVAAGVMDIDLIYVHRMRALPLNSAPYA